MNEGRKAGRYKEGRKGRTITRRVKEGKRRKEGREKGRKGLSKEGWMSRKDVKEESIRRKEGRKEA